MTSNLPAAATRAALARPEVIATFFHGLSDPTRVRILELLAERPMTVPEIVGAVGLAQGRVSSHLSCRAGAATSRRPWTAASTATGSWTSGCGTSCVSGRPSSTTTPLA